MSDGQPKSKAVAATHPDAVQQPVLVGPATGDEFNTVRASLIPRACFSLEESHFEFDSSFIFPMGLTFDAGPLKTLLEKHPGFRLSIFGHTDPVGQDDFNKVLSGRRAQSVFGLLVRNVDLWEDLYRHHDNNGKDKWGVKSVQAMLNLAGPTKAGSVDGKIGPLTRQALSDFESANGLPAKSFDQKEELDAPTFKALASLYMDAVCTDDDGAPFRLKPEDFIAQGKGKDGKGDFQGCGEFNPLMMFSGAEKVSFDKPQNKAERNKENQVNRRVMILLYPPGTLVDPDRWPCPSAKEGVAGCTKRFFANASERRSNLAERREHKDEPSRPDMVGTFACRFYERQTTGSPCEQPVPPVPVQEVHPVIMFGTDDVRGISGRSFVVVKKPHTTPARVPVTLKSDRAFEGTGQFTITDNGNVRFFPDRDSLLAIRFDGTANVFTGEQLTAGVTLFAEGIKASTAVDDITLVLTISAAQATIASVARAQMTAVDITLDICGPRTSPRTDPTPLPQPTTSTPPPGTPTDKFFGGRALRFMDPGKTQQRALVIARLQPAAFQSTLELTSSLNTVSLFDDENPKSAAAALAFPFAIGSNTIPANGRRLFLQGDTVSNAVRDVQLQLGIQGVEPDGDRVTVTVTGILEIILDANGDHQVDENEPVATFVRFGVWDQGYDGASNVRNALAENNNFVGNDHRRFYFRVRDPLAAGNSVNINWRTLKADKSNDDAPASQVLTLVETSGGSKVFVSRAVSLVTDDTDARQPTNSGLAAPLPDVGARNRGQSNHRLRRATMTGFVKGEYQPAGRGSDAFELPIFLRNPDERRRLKPRVINYGSNATAAYIADQFSHANFRWNQVGLQVDAQATVDRPIPAGVLNGAGLYAGSSDNPNEVAALADLIPITPDGTLTVVFVPMTGANAYATVAQRNNSALGNRFFIFINTTLALTDETLAHELHHVLFNRFDVAVPQQFFTFNTTAPAGFGIPLPDVRVYRRIQNLHSPNPDNDPNNNNVLNWMKRVRTARFPVGGSNGAPTATTGNTLTEAF